MMNCVSMNALFKLGPPPLDGASGPLCKEDSEHVDIIMVAEGALNERR